MNEGTAPGGFTRIVVRGVSLAGGGWVFGQGLNLVIYLVLARLASPEEFGQLAAGSILVVVGGLFADSGMTAALIQRRDRIEEAANTALLATLAAGLALTLLALAAAPLVGLFFDSREIAWIAAAASGWILLRTATAVPDALMQRRFSFLRRLVVEPLGVVVFGVTSIVALSAGMGVWGLVIGNTAQRLAMLIAAWGLARWRPQPRLASLALWKEMVRYGRHVIAGEVIRKVGGQVQTALIGRFVGTAPLGQFTYAQRIAQKPYGLVVNAGSYVLFPAFSRISHDADRMRAAFLRSLRWICLVAMPIGFAMVPLAIPMALILFGERWELAGEAAMAMFAFVGFRGIVAVTTEAAKAIGQPQMLVRVWTLSAILSVALVAALVQFGLVGVGVAISLSSIGTAVYSLSSIRSRLALTMRSLLVEIWPALLAAIAMAAALLALDRLVIEVADREVAAGIVLLIGEIALAVAVYLGVLALIAPAMSRELLGILVSVRRRIGRRRRGEDALDHDAAPPTPADASTLPMPADPEGSQAP